MSVHLADTQDHKRSEGGGHRCFSRTGSGRGPWMTGGGRSCVLLDREAERAAIDRVLAAARGGLSSTLVLRGGPGVGKTTLLQYAVAAATGPARLQPSPGLSRRSAWSSAACTGC